VHQAQQSRPSHSGSLCDATPPRIARARQTARGAALAIAVLAAPATASPNVPLDDPVYDQLDQLDLAGMLPLFHGGLVPLTEARVHELLPDAPTVPTGWWIAPIERAALHIDAAHETTRGYSTPARPRDVAGILALSCERQYGAPCGNGLGLAAELDAAAGYGPWAAGALRLRARTGSSAYATALDLDRAYLSAALGPIAAEVGRDALVLGPASQTQVGWGSNAPPLDHSRLSAARPFALVPHVRANLVYVLGQLAAPQTYPGDLVTIARAQLDIDDRVELGAMQLLQLGGDGAPGFGLWDFVLEHVRRRDPSASASDSSNRRFGFDIATRIAALGGARITYQLIFEDLRKQFVSALRYDTDHVLDLDLRWLRVELQSTGVRSYEHIPRITGFTSGGRIVGDPLGPAAQAVLVAARIPVRSALLMPWAEVARLASDTYDFVENGPIVKTGGGPAEWRVRIGARARVPLGCGLELDPEAALEDVERASFVPGSHHVNAIVRAMLVWRAAAAAPSSTCASAVPSGCEVGKLICSM
jgi:Capsule assembly protein Wzi